MEPAVTPPTGLDLDAGVTLIELVVVLAVLASLGLGVTLTRGATGARGDSDLMGFRSSYDQARSLAVHGQRRRGILLSAAGLRLAWGGADGWQISERSQPWRGRVSYHIDGPQMPPEIPNIIFLPNGQTTAFSIQFDQITCRSDGWTGLICAEK
jgi:prepilin-type N-terminal cleavage/methylation domain-containing protein